MFLSRRFLKLLSFVTFEPVLISLNVRTPHLKLIFSYIDTISILLWLNMINI